MTDRQPDVAVNDLLKEIYYAQCEAQEFVNNI